VPAFVSQSDRVMPPSSIKNGDQLAMSGTPGSAGLVAVERHRAECSDRPVIGLLADTVTTTLEPRDHGRNPAPKNNGFSAQ